MLLWLTSCLPQVQSLNLKRSKESNMPQVGKKKFPYTDAGMKDAKVAAKKTGKKMKMAPKKKK